MRHHTTIPALIILLVLPTLVLAGTLESVTGTADCAAWSADLTIGFRGGTVLSRVEYVVLLLDEAGTEVDRFEFADFIQVPDTPTGVFTFGGNWNTALAGNYQVTGNFSVYDIFDGGFNLTEGSFTANVACGTVSREPVCRHRARYWARHPAEWPVTALEIAGKQRTQDELMEMMRRQHKRHTHGFRLTRQLIAAKLNLASGSSDVVQDLVAKADQHLASLPDRHRGRRWGQWRRGAMRLKRELYRYNRAGCESDADDTASIQGDLKFMTDADPTADIEVMSLGTLKAMYK